MDSDSTQPQLTCEQRRAIEYGIEPPAWIAPARYSNPPRDHSCQQARRGQEPGRSRPVTQDGVWIDEYGTVRASGDFS